MNLTKIKNYTEPMLFLGTDILQDIDLDLMSKKIETSFERNEGAIYYITESKIKDYKRSGYSKEFCEVMSVAHSRGYMWVFFDRDIETEFNE